MASWVDIPVHWREMEKSRVVDLLWTGFIVPLAGGHIVSESPIEKERPNERAAWFMNEKESVRLVVAVRVNGTRAVLMSAGSPVMHSSARTDQKLLRFLNSFEPE
jgi:hypothetical protein